MKKISAIAKRFPSQKDGVAAIEFALILPVIITIYFATFELARTIDMNEKVSLVGRTIADLSGRADNPTPSDSDMANIISAANVIMRPFDATKMQFIVSAMGVVGKGDTYAGFVCSSWSQNAQKRIRMTPNETEGLPPLPAGYRYDGARYIIAEVRIGYTPFIGENLYKKIFGTGGLVFSRQIPWAERTASEVIMPGGTACPSDKISG